jgi:hypothetical protein
MARSKSARIVGAIFLATVLNLTTIFGGAVLAQDFGSVASRIVRILAYRTGDRFVLGSGIVLAADGVVATDRRLLEGATSLFVIDGPLGPAGNIEQGGFRAMAISESAELDVAILRAPGLVKQPATLAFVRNDAEIVVAAFATEGLNALNERPMLRSGNVIAGAAATVAPASLLLLQGDFAAVPAQAFVFDACGRLVGFGFRSADSSGQSATPSPLHAAIPAALLPGIARAGAAVIGEPVEFCATPVRTAAVSQNDAVARPVLDVIDRAMALLGMPADRSTMLAAAGLGVLVVAVLVAVVLWRRKLAPPRRAAAAETASVAGYLGSLRAMIGGSAVEFMLRRDDLLRSPSGLVLGRSRDGVDYVMDEESISRQHLRFTLAVGRLYVEDLNSANGSWLDGVPLAAFKPMALPPDAKIVCGSVALEWRGEP